MDVTQVLAHILIVIVAAKLAAEVAERIGVPTVVAEILAGVAVGPSALGLVGSDEVLRVVGEIGVLLLLLDVGLEMDLRELGAVGRASVAVAVVGVVLPMAGGVAVASLMGHGGNTGLFIGAALTATSVGITARVFGDLRALATVEARTVLGAAVADDVLGLVILTVVVRLVDEGTVAVGAVAGIIGLAVGFLVVASVVGLRVAPPAVRWVQRSARSAGTLVALAFAFTLALAELADASGLAPIIGAFVAGIALSRSAHVDRIRRELTPVGHLFIPVFFLQIGIDADLDAMMRPEVLGLAGALLAVAVVGKLLAAAGAFGSPGDKVLIGLGMLPRGEVGLIFAGIGLRTGVLNQDLYGALLIVVLATTLVTPTLLRARLRRVRAHRAAASPVAPPDGRWLSIEDGRVALHGIPALDDALHVSLRAASLASQARPGPALLDWLTTLPDEPLRWDATATAELLNVLREGSPRSWRFLEVTGVLGRALPELADALRRRQADPLELDPAGVLRWSLVDAVRHTGDPFDGAGIDQLDKPEWLVLAALILDAAGVDAAPVELAHQLVRRLDLGAAAEDEIALLVGESGLLRAAASRGDGLDETSVLQLASHIERPERARALYLLSMAIGGLDEVGGARLVELHDRVQAVLARPELTGEQARTLIEDRLERVAALAPSPFVLDRVRAGPRGWVLAHPPETLVRHAALVEPLATKGTVRLRVGAGAPGEWTLDIAGRDQPGFLAAVTGVLAAGAIDVSDAWVATWADGAIIESFAVRASTAPSAHHLEDAIAAALRKPPVPLAVPEARLTFDDAASPWYTICDVAAPDRTGLLHALAAAFAAAGVDVHAAAIGGGGGVAEDRFELTNGRGAKLHDSTKDRVRTILAGHERGRRGRDKRRARDRHTTETLG